MNAPLIVKLKFYPPGTGAKNAAHAKYIATRPGADRGELEAEELDAAGHVKYAAERPRSHGLFGPDEEQVPVLEKVQDELRRHEGIVWRAVVSLREDDAQRLGYLTREAWERALRTSVSEVAHAMGIRESNLRWVAAFHAEAGHPHVHLLFWEAAPERTRGVVSKGERKDIRRAFARQIFAEERSRLYAEKTAIRDLIRDLAKGDVTQAQALARDVFKAQLEVEAMNGKAAGVPPRLYDEVRIELAQRLENLARIMPGRGRVALKYMPEDVKSQAREIADWLLKQPVFVLKAERYTEVARELASHHTLKPEALAHAAEKAYADLRDRVAQVVLRAAGEINRVDRHAALDTSRLANSVWRAAWRALERERTRAEAQAELEKRAQERKQQKQQQRNEEECER
jgi:hypothetical protein